ncbi:hypothetical protein ACIRPT_33670 [Streptomyces sp. NPDC101227]|uniref:terpene synthase family protein n=1 Tax=Streptomyces sp. NPDC101227 TaxID=3366136 RepID=UPI0037FF31C3
MTETEQKSHGSTFPQLKAPFPSRISPHAAQAEAGVLAWARRFGLMTSEAAVRRFEGVHAGDLAARTYSTAGPAELQLVTDWLGWMFLFDDQGDEGERGRDPRKWATLMAPFHAVLADTHVMAQRTPSLALALADLLNRSEEGMPQSWCARLRRHVRTYIDSYEDEAANRAQQTPPTLAQYIPHRRASGAMYIVYDLAESVVNAEVPLELYQSREYQDLLVAAIDAVCWQNDIASTRKEEARGDVHNLVIVLRAAIKCSLQEAVERAVDMTNVRMAGYVESRRLMDHLLAAGGFSPGCQEEVRCCLGSYEDWMRGHIEWWSYTARYTDIVHTEPGTAPEYIEPLLT